MKEYYAYLTQDFSIVIYHNSVDGVLVEKLFKVATLVLKDTKKKRVTKDGIVEGAIVCVANGRLMEVYRIYPEIEKFKL